MFLNQQTLNLTSAAGRQNHLPSTASEQSSSLDIDLFKDYSKEVASPTARLRPSPSVAVPTNDRGLLQRRRVSEPPIERDRVSKQEAGMQREQPPLSQQPGEEEEGPSYQWMHQPEVLIKGCCNYTAFVSLFCRHFSPFIFHFKSFISDLFHEM